MKKVWICLFACLLCAGVQAQKKARISAVADGYSGQVIDFEFIDNTDNNMQYPYREGQRMEFDVELKEPSLVKVNLWMWMMVCPGDDIQTNIHYAGRNLRTVEYAGTPSAVALNQAISKGRDLRVAARYKTNPLAAVVTQVPVNDYYEMTQKFWKQEQEILQKVREQSNAFAYNYAWAELEGMYLSNLTKYPYIVSDVNRKKLEECIPAGYWNILDGYTVKEDEASLKSVAYLGWLLEYKEYMEKRQAHLDGKTYTPERDLKKSYESIAAFYDGKVRDAVLYVFLYRALSSPEEFDTAEQLCKDYFKKYNKNKSYRKELTEMMK